MAITSTSRSLPSRFTSRTRSTEKLRWRSCATLRTAIGHTTTAGRVRSDNAVMARPRSKFVWTALPALDRVPRGDVLVDEPLKGRGKLLVRSPQRRDVPSIDENRTARLLARSRQTDPDIRGL